MKTQALSGLRALRASVCPRGPLRFPPPAGVRSAGKAEHLQRTRDSSFSLSSESSERFRTLVALPADMFWLPCFHYPLPTLLLFPVVALLGRPRASC